MPGFLASRALNLLKPEIFNSDQGSRLAVEALPACFRAAARVMIPGGSTAVF